MKKFLAIILALVMVLALAACGAKSADTDAETETDGETADNAEVVAVTDGAEIGEGEHSFTLEIVDAEGAKITATVKTDATVVGDALQDYGIIEGEMGEYGLYVKTVNGITADYDVDGSYWAFYVDGEYATTGVDMTDIVDGAVYTLAVETMS